MMSDYKGKMPVRGDGDYNLLTNEEPSSQGLIASDRDAAIGVATMNKRPTATAGDEDKIALDVSVSDGDGNSINLDNPLPVYISDSPEAEILDYDKAVDTAKDGGFTNHDYVTASEFRGLNVECNSGGLASFELQVETGVAAGTYNTIMRKHNSVAQPSVIFANRFPQAIASGITIRVVKTNLDNQATDMDSSINGKEV